MNRRGFIGGIVAACCAPVELMKPKVWRSVGTNVAIATNAKSGMSQCSTVEDAAGGLWVIDCDVVPDRAKSIEMFRSSSRKFGPFQPGKPARFVGLFGPDIYKKTS